MDYTAMLQRKKLPHDIPPWTPSGGTYFITVCSTLRGLNQLCRDTVFDLLMQSVRYYRDVGHWRPHLVLFMPDHMHAITSFAENPGLIKTISDWKHYTARKCKISWQRDYFEHRLRHDESLVEKLSYIRMNPVRAGLVGTPEEWPYVWPQAGMTASD